MSKKEFAQFLSRQPTPETEDRVDWEARKSNYVGFVDLLYADIESYLADFSKDGNISKNYRHVGITEESIGSYTIREMTILIGPNRIVLTPIGTLLFGTMGRVDMNGPRGTKRLILADKESDGLRVRFVGVNDAAIDKPRQITWEWKIMSETQRPLYTAVNQDSFLDAIISISNG